MLSEHADTKLKFCHLYKKISENRSSFSPLFWVVVVVAPGLGNQVETLARKGSAEFHVSVSYLRDHVCGFRVYL